MFSSRGHYVLFTVLRGIGIIYKLP